MNVDELPLPLTAIAEPAAAPTPADGTAERLAAFAVELWRVKTRLGRALPLLPAKEGRPLETSVTRLEELLAESGLTVEDPLGRPYVEGERLDVLLFEPQADVTRPTVAQTVKPAVYLGGALFKLAQVIVAVPPAEQAP